MARLLLIAAALTAAGCDDQPKTKTEVKVVNAYQISSAGGSQLASLVVVDGCEYLVLPSSYGNITMTHKGNCKYCMERLGDGGRLRLEKEPAVAR
jgi:hypothetical protein